MDWSDFKRSVENNGIKDTDRIEFIDTGSYPDSIDVNRHEDGSFTITGQ
jgi:hypothetical protein